jgi:hypothetical protein
LALVFLLLTPALPLVAQMPQPFSADMTTVHTNGTKMTGKIYFSPPRMRIDMTSMGEQHGPFGGNMSMIVDPPAQTSYMLMPQAQMYMQFRANDANGSMNQGMRNLQNLTQRGTCPEGTTCKKVGTETVNGRSCDRYENTDKEGRHSTAWIDQKLHFPIRLQETDSTTDFTNVREGPQDPSLFQVPAGYKPFDPRELGGQRRPR